MGRYFKRSAIIVFLVPVFLQVGLLAGGSGSLQGTSGGKDSSVERLLNPVPAQLTGASCNEPGGTATLTMASNPIQGGQWIAVRDVPPSAPIAVTDERVGTGNGSTTTFTFRTANYPIRHGSVTILAGGVPQGVDAPGAVTYEIGGLHGPGMGSFNGTVTITGGTKVALTSVPAVFDSRWQAFMPVIAGQPGKYVIGSGKDSTHLTLMAPATDGAGQSFSLTSQVNYVAGVIEVTFASAPSAGVSITINYTAEPSQWNGERKVESTTSKTVSYKERHCTGANATSSSGRVYAIPVIYVAPASHTSCSYDGDKGQTCTPNDSNPGTMKTLPKATLVGVLQALNRHILNVPYMIQLADADGSGLGGSKSATDCYQPNEVTFTGVTMGGSPADQNERLRVENYPQSYWWVHGNAHNPGSVLLNGSGNCSKSSRTVATGEALRFDHTVARVEGLSVQGYGNDVGSGMGLSAISFVNFASGYVENIVCTGSDDLSHRSVTLCVGDWDHSTVKVGGNHTVHNANWLHAVNESNLFTADPADGPTQNTNLDYSSTEDGFAMGCSIMSNCQIDHLTATFTGSGRYTAQFASEKSSLFYAERYFGSQCPNAACMDITINAPNMTWERSGLGGHIDGTCGNYQEGVCTVIAGPAIRAEASEDSFIKEYSQSVITAPDIVSAGGCVEVWNAGWESKPGSQPPTCSALALRSESKSFVPLTLQSASGSTNTDLLDLMTGTGTLAAAFNAAGQISRINGVATAGNGVAAEVYSAVSAATNASIAATSMLTPGADGNFTARFYVTQVDAGTGCADAARVAVKLIYSDPFFGGAQPVTFVVPLNTSGGAASTALKLGTGAITAANVATGSITFRAKGVTNIQYSTTFTNGACTTQPSYRIVALLESF